MKIAVLGLSDTSVVALDAIEAHQHEPILVLVKGIDMSINISTSPLNELNFGYPGAQEEVIKFHVQGGLDNWEAAHPQIDKTGLHAFEGIKPVTSDKRIIRSILPRSTILSFPWDPQVSTLNDLLEKECEGVDAIINTIDRIHFCGEDDHQFICTRVWWSNTKGPKISPGNVLYNAAEEPSWAITSNIDGEHVTIWDRQPPYDDVHAYDLPTRMTCTCDSPGIGLHVGRQATYRPIGLAQVYEQVVEFLYNPLSRLVDTDPTQPFAPIKEDTDGGQSD
jgi:hypothetical protein